MKPGTRSLLWGEHQFLLHPLFVALAWWKLFGFPLDPRLWFCFFVHDIGYLGKPNMDGTEGKTHPETGARIAHALFDPDPSYLPEAVHHQFLGGRYSLVSQFRWYDFCLYHSRFYAKRDRLSVSALALADKLSFNLTPRWLYRLLVHLSGCLPEYLSDSGKRLGVSNFKDWHRKAGAENLRWVYETLKKPVKPGYYYF